MIDDKKIIDVTTLNNYINNLLEGDIFLSRIYIKGEISSLNKHYTGNYYFNLKDENSKISCIMFSSYVTKLKDEINNGDQVIIFAKVNAYPKNGTYSLMVYSLIPYGKGLYLLELEKLKNKLLKEGLFSLEKKKIPLYPKEIAIVTSSSGAAVKDLIHTITSRWPCIIRIFPSLVQGKNSSKSIISQLKKADESNCDTIILSRGGGSNDDLSAFNDEELVRCCASLNKPLISAIGHQIDQSLVDLVSSFQAITPTEAGEKACPDIIEIKKNINKNFEIITKSINNYIVMKKNILLQNSRLIEINNPINYLIQLKTMIEKTSLVLENNIKFKISNLQNQIMIINSKIELLNPNLIFEKGYSLTYLENKRIKSINDVNKNDILTIKVNDGTIKVEVIDKYERK